MPGEEAFAEAAEKLTVWRFEVGGGGGEGGEGGEPCDTCQAMEGLYDEEPPRPHYNCSCSITQEEIEARLISEERDLFDSYELLEEIGWIPKGGSFTKEQNWSTETSHTNTTTVGTEGGPVSVSVGSEDSESESSGGAASVTFNYDDDEGGELQLVVAVYEVEIWRTTSTWVFETPGGTEMEF